MHTFSLGGGKWQAAKRHTLDANGLWQAAMWHTLGADELQQAAMRHTLGDDGLQQATKQHTMVKKQINTSSLVSARIIPIMLCAWQNHLNILI